MRPKPLLCLVLIAACAAPGSGGFHLDSMDPDHPRVRYDDGQVSPNDSCMVRLGRKLSPNVRPIYVNGTPMGFC